MSEEKITPISLEQCIRYEAYSSFWTGYMGTDFLRALSAAYIEWKVNVKYIRYKRRLKFKEIMEELRCLKNPK